MDLLTLRRTAVAAATLVVAAAVGGCGVDPASTSHPASHTAPHATDRQHSGPPSEAPGLQPLRPDEQVIVRRSGVGDTSAAGVAGELVILYTVCQAPRPIRVRTNLPRVAPMTVPCDGVVSRAQIYTDPGRRFRVDLSAPSSTSWHFLVTQRDE